LETSDEKESKLKSRNQKSPELIAQLLTCSGSIENNFINSLQLEDKIATGIPHSPPSLRVKVIRSLIGYQQLPKSIQFFIVLQLKFDIETIEMG
jgi:hypothetical protein